MKSSQAWERGQGPRPSFCLGVVLCAALCFASLTVHAADYYVAPDGDNANPGTLEQPFASMARGQQAANAGDTVYFRGGTYRFTSNSAADGVVLDKSGRDGSPIKYFAYENEVPVFDFSGMTAELRITGIRVTGNWIHLKGFEVKLVPQNLDRVHNESWGIYNTGDNNVYERLDLHHNMGPGFFLGEGANNLILNCDSHHNYDPKSRAGDGENADGFGCHPKTGDTGNVFRGVRAWWNTDDGYDSINAQESCLVENSWAWYNGYLPDTFDEPMRDPTLPPGNGNGFKLGGFGIDGSGSPNVPPKHTIRSSVAFLNVFAGFFANYHTSGHYFYNNTGFQNLGADFNMLGLNEVNTSTLRNNVAYGPNYTAYMEGTDDAFNSWSLAVEVTEADFQSIDFTGMDGPRQADGSLPIVPFMRLVPGSDLIDQGVDVDLPFEGAAPDLGAYEGAELVPMGGVGGMPGMGGAGSGGMTGTSTTSTGGVAGVGGVATNGGMGGAAQGATGALGVTGAGAGGPVGAGSTGGPVGTGSTGDPVGAGSTDGPVGAGSTDGPVGATASVGAGGAALTLGPPPAASDGGCTCRVGTRTTPARVSLVFGAGAFLLTLRRRRPRRRGRGAGRRVDS